ncbi:MAG: SOS response-associated peptidase [Terriglobales bacterium]
MCGRFTLRSDGNALAQQFEAEPVQEGAGAGVGHWSAHYNLAPTQPVPVVRINPTGGGRELILLRWGLVPPWSAPDKPPPALFNARAETLADKMVYRQAFRNRRCLIPADGFYEWKAEGKRKQPWFVHRAGDGMFAFAGLWTGAACTIVTTEPVPLLKELHNRMPAMLAPADYAGWLGPAPLEVNERMAMLGRIPEDLELHPVRPLVNHAAHDVPGCVEPWWEGS